MLELFDILFGVLIGLGIYHYYYLKIDKTVHVQMPEQTICLHIPPEFTTLETRQLRRKVDILEGQRLNSIKLDVGRWAFQYGESDEHQRRQIEKHLADYNSYLTTEVEKVK